jgi:hypothetical protein
MSTRKNGKKRLDDLRSDHDFSSLGKGVRGKYFNRATAGSNVVLIDPELSKAFPTEGLKKRPGREIPWKRSR